MLTKDKLWKAVFEDFFPEAILFFFPGFFPKIDWARGFEMLDKELKELFNDSMGNERRADFLVKVWLLDGTEQWLLFHIEVQGYFDKDFPKRMFIYYYRLTERYEVPIAALALLTDANKDWRPDCYISKCLDTELRYSYPVFKLSDYRPQDFDTGNNPWAIVMKTALAALEPDQDDDSLLQVKTGLYRELREAGHTAGKVRSMFQFIKYYVQFGKKEYFPKFDKEIKRLDNKKNQSMGLIELVKEHLLEEAKSEGLQKGMEKGLEKGLEKGIEKGIEKGMEEGIEKGQLKKAMTGLRNMSKKGFSADDAAAILEVPENLALQVYGQLKKEPQITGMLSAGLTDVGIIAEQLKVHPLLVEVIKDSTQ